MIKKKKLDTTITKHKSAIIKFESLMKGESKSGTKKLTEKENKESRQNA